MFSKNTEKLECLIGHKTDIKGNIKAKGTLRIDGNVEGNIEADWLVLGEKAFLKGNVEARGIVVGGRIEGNLKAKEIIDIKSKGYVAGEIASPKLAVTEGGILDGRSSMQRTEEESKVIELPAAKQ